MVFRILEQTQGNFLLYCELLLRLPKEADHRYHISRSLELNTKMASLVFIAILVLGCHGVFCEQRDGFIDKLSSGMKLATNFLGSESVALKVAEFVVKAFQTANKASPNRRQPSDYQSEEYPRPSDKYSRPNEEYSRPNEEYSRPSEVTEVPSPLAPLKHLVRLFGLQPNQISAVAVNALVFVAQMISTFLSGPQRPFRPYRSEDPTTWILNKNSKPLQELIAAAKNESLPDSIEDMIKQQGSEEETSCIRLLVCKITPFVNKMQKAVFGKEEFGSETLRGSAIMYRHLPSADEITERHAICEKRHRNCNLNE